MGRTGRRKAAWAASFVVVVAVLAASASAYWFMDLGTGAGQVDAASAVDAPSDVPDDALVVEPVDGYWPLWRSNPPRSEGCGPETFVRADSDGAAERRFTFVILVGGTPVAERPWMAREASSDNDRILTVCLEEGMSVRVEEDGAARTFALESACDVFGEATIEVRGATGLSMRNGCVQSVPEAYGVADQGVGTVGCLWADVHVQGDGRQAHDLRLSLVVDGSRSASAGVAVADDWQRSYQAGVSGCVLGGRLEVLVEQEGGRPAVVPVDLQGCLEVGITLWLERDTPMAATQGCRAPLPRCIEIAGRFTQASASQRSVSVSLVGPDWLEGPVESRPSDGPFPAYLPHRCVETGRVDLILEEDGDRTEVPVDWQACPHAAYYVLVLEGDEPVQVRQECPPDHSGS